MPDTLESSPAHAGFPVLWRRIEGPTWLVAAAVHAGWLALTWHHHALPWWLILPLGGWLVAWHSSLQHEVLHGHPTGRQRLDTTLALAPLILWLPYPLYRSRHRRHHAVPALTDPWTDPESFYVEDARWRRLGPCRRFLLRVNNTLAGRLLIGPPLAVLGFWREEGARLLRRDPGCLRIWASHGALTALLLAWTVGVCGIPLWAYVLLYVYPGTALILLRSYREHRPAPRQAERTAIVEAGPLMTLLFLGNNYHALHHERPGIPWFELPRVYRAERDRLLADNDGFLFAGYGDIVRRFLWREKDSPRHPGLSGRTTKENAPMSDSAAPGGPGLLERLAAGPVICAEGYLFEIERRGYLTAGAYVPEAVLEHPEAVARLHRDFLHAGSDVMLAFTYYAHREKLRVIGKEGMLEEMNRAALRLAREAAGEGDALVAGNVCNSNIYVHGDSDSARTVRAMFDEQVGWAVDEGVDFICAETISYVSEALLALEAIKAAGQTAVINLAVHRDPRTREGLSLADAARRLEDAGADVVGLNCARGPASMLPLLGPICEAVSGPVAALPVAYRTSAEEPTFQSLSDPGCACLPDGRPFPTALDPFTVNRYEIKAFTRDAHALGVNYLGVCCGAGPHHIRAVAEALGRRPPASAYSPDMSQHAFYGTDDKIPGAYRDFAKHL